MEIKSKIKGLFSNRIGFIISLVLCVVVFTLSAKLDKVTQQRDATIYQRDAAIVELNRLIGERNDLRAELDNTLYYKVRGLFVKSKDKLQTVITSGTTGFEKNSCIEGFKDFYSMSLEKGKNLYQSLKVKIEGVFA